MTRRGCSLPANASGFDPHRASITSRFGQVVLDLDAVLVAPLVLACVGAAHTLNFSAERHGSALQVGERLF
jgi:hypothetical protein